MLDIMFKITLSRDSRTPSSEIMKYRFQVNTAGDPVDSWAGNAITYDTAELAELAARDLFMRWTAVNFWRVIDQNGKVIMEGPE